MPRQSGITIRALREDDLPTADRILRLAFGTFLGLPDPLTFMGDADYVRSRWLADPSAVIGAELDGEIVGTNFVTRWGSMGFFGPLTIRPDLWNRGISQLLLAPTMELFERWGIRHAGLFTFADSTKHAGLVFLLLSWSWNLKTRLLPRNRRCLADFPSKESNFAFRSAAN
jgi:hypothetical protein